MQAVQVVTQCRAGQRLPAVVARQAGNGVTQPVQLQGATQLEVVLCHFVLRQFAAFADFDDVHQRHGKLQTRQHAGQFLRHVRHAQAGFQLGHGRVLFGIHQRRETCQQFLYLAGVLFDHGIHRGERTLVAQHPAGYALDQGTHQHHHLHLLVGRNQVVQRFDLAPQVFRIKHAAGNPPGAGDVGRGERRLFLQAEHEGGTHAVDDLVGQLVGDDFATQLMLFHLLAKTLLQRFGEVVHQHRQEVGIVRHIGSQNGLIQRNLAVSQQYGDFRHGETLTRQAAFVDLGIGRQVFDFAVQLASLFHVRNHAGMGGQHGSGFQTLDGQHLGLQHVVAQHQMAHFFGHFGQQFITLFQRHVTGLHHRAQQDLDVDFVVGAIHTSGVVDGVGGDTAAAQRKFDTAQLGASQVTAFGYHAGLQFVAIDTYRIASAVAGVGMALAGSLDVSTDTAVVQQVDLGLEDFMDQLVRRHVVLVGFQPCLDFRRQRNGLGRAFENATALGNQLAVVIGPAGTRQIEQAGTFGKAGLGVRGRVQEDVQVVERGLQADVFGQQHAVAEYVASHVTNADHAEILLLGVDAQMTEVALDRFPGTAGGNAHALVVVTGGTTGSKGVTQPEAVGFGNAVGNVGEGCGALVGSHHQVRIIRVQTAHVLGRNDLAGHQVVGDIQQCGDEDLVAGDAFGQEGFTVARCRQLLADKATLGTHRHDDGVLHHLRLHQTQHFGTEVFHAVGPAQAATGYLGAAQVHAFHTRAVDPDFKHRARLRQEGNQLGFQLEGHIGLELAVGILLPEVGAAGSQNHGQEAVQDAVFIQVGHIVQQLFHFSQQHVGAGVVGIHRVQAGHKQRHQTTGDFRIVGHALFQIVLAEGEAALTQILGQCTHQRDFTPVQAGNQRQTVEAVVFATLGKHLGQQLLEVFLYRFAGHLFEEGTHVQAKVADPYRRTVFTLDTVRMLVTYLDAHVFQNRQAGGQAHWLAFAEQLQVECLVAAMERTVQLHGQRVAGRHGFQQLHVQHCITYGKLFTVSHREGRTVTLEQQVAGFFAMHFHQLLVHFFHPATHQTGDFRLDVGFAEGRQLGRIGADDVMHARQRAVADLYAELGRVAIEGGHQHFFDLQAHFGVEAVTRHVYQAADIAVVAVLAHEQAHARALLQADNTFGDRAQYIGRNFKQLVARIAFQHETQGLGLVAVVHVVAVGHHAGHLLTHQRNVFRGCLIGTGSIQAEETALANHFALVVEALDADKVDIGRAMDDGAGLRLVQDDQLRQVRQFAQFLRQSFKAGGVFLVALVAQDAEAGILDDLQAVLAITLYQVVVAIAHEQEVIGCHPAEEIHGFLGFHRTFALHLGQVLADVAHHGAHFRLVAHHQTDVGNDAVQFGFQLLQGGSIANAVDLHVDEGFQRQAAVLRAFYFQQVAVLVATNRQHRVHQEVQVDVVARQQHGAGVNQERHVVVDAFNHRVGALPAITLEIGSIDTHLVLTGAALARELEMGQCGTEQVQRGKLAQVGMFGFFEVDREESGELWCLLG